MQVAAHTTRGLLGGGHAQSGERMPRTTRSARAGRAARAPAHDGAATADGRRARRALAAHCALGGCALALHCAQRCQMGYRGPGAPRHCAPFVRFPPFPLLLVLT